jgi:WD40 repeat protein
VLAAGLVNAQEDRPQLVLNPGGAVTTVTSLAFSPDSSRLYVGGHDKFVQVWELREFGRVVRRHDAVPAGYLRWELSRGLRGAIFCLAVSPTAPLLAVGGQSTRGSGGNIVLFDTATAKLSKVLLGARGGVPVGHGQSVASLSFSPTGTRLASLSADGELRIWDTATWQSRILQTPDGRIFGRRPVHFFDDHWIVASRWSPGTQTWHVAKYDTDLAQPRAEVLAQSHIGGVTALGVDPAGGRWASADSDGHVFVWDGLLARRPRLVRRNRIATSLTFGSAGTLYIATEADRARRTSSLLEMWDPSPARQGDDRLV